MPIGFVRIIASPGRAPEFATIASGRIVAGDREAELDLLVVDAVPADEDDARLAQLVHAAFEHADEPLVAQRVDRPADDRERRQRRATHRVDVAERIRRRDLAEEVRIVDARREDIHRLHQAELRAHLEDARVVGGAESDEQPRIADRRQPREDSRRVPRREFSRRSRRS